MLLLSYTLYLFYIFINYTPPVAGACGKVTLGVIPLTTPRY